MRMPCRGCAREFTFFSREHSCPNCGFSFCSDCLKEKIKVNDKQQRICSYCFNKVTESDTPMAEQDFDPPALLLKRLETMENPVKPPITIFKQKAKWVNLKSGLAPEDKQILDRLEKLREDRKLENVPSENEIKRRLLLLKGLNEESTKTKTALPPQRTAQEEVDDLLSQYINEAVLDKKLNTENEQIAAGMEERLENLRMESESDSDEDNSSDVDNESGPLWCVICNQDAVLKCLSCDGSLYCNTCFKQGHEFFEMKDHRTVEINTEEM